MRPDSLSPAPPPVPHESDAPQRRGRFVRWVPRILCVFACVGLWSLCPEGLAQETGPVEEGSAATTPAGTTPGKRDLAAPDKDGWKPLVDGKSLEGWKITDVGGQGEVTVADDVVSLGMGATLTGITYTRDFPKCDYEFQMEARRVEGVDFFGTVTFPVGDSFCSLVVGGWGGSVVGISCINGSSADENETTKYLRFAKGQWYRVRIVVQRDRVQAWIDDQQVVDLETAHRKLSTRVEVYRCQPLGVASWVTRAELRHLRYRLLDPARDPAGTDTASEESKSGPDQPGAEEKKTEAKKSEAGSVDA